MKFANPIYQYVQARYGMKIDRTFTTTEVCTVVGVGRPAFQVWMKWLKPSVKASGGHGDSARWSLGDLVVAKTFQSLTKAGISRQTAAFCSKDVGPLFDLPSDYQKAKSVWYDLFLGDKGKFIASEITTDPPLEYLGKSKTRSDYKDCKVVVSVSLTKVFDEVKEAIKSL